MPLVILDINELDANTYFFLKHQIDIDQIGSWIQQLSYEKNKEEIDIRKQLNHLR